MPYSYELWSPRLTFSAHNDEVELLQAKMETSELIVNFKSASGWILKTTGVDLEEVAGVGLAELAEVAGVSLAAVAGVPPAAFLSAIKQLISFTSKVDDTKDALIQAKIDKDAVNRAFSDYEAEVKVIRNRLNRMVQDIPRRHKEHEVVPALAACEKTLALFEDTTYAFWQKPEVSSPLLVSFAGLYVVIAKMAVELIDTYKNEIAKEMKRLGDVVDDYRKRFLCFRIYKVKYLVVSFKVVKDSYDKKFGKSQRHKWNCKVKCYCMVKQEYTAHLGKTYGSFFDSAKLAIVQSGLLAPDVTLKTNWCTEHPRCSILFRDHKSCICVLNEGDLIFEHWYANCKDADLMRMITAGKCLADISSAKSSVRHYGYSCLTCNTDKPNELICISCIRTCHEGHKVEFSRCDWFFCFCGSKSSSMNCKLQIEEQVPNVDVSMKNRDGAVVTRGNSGPGGDTGKNSSELYYCGRFMNDCRCGNCNGRCGPNNGCPCQACLEYAKAEYNWSCVYCKKCKENPLVGPRYKCTECDDYDLCHDCLQKGNHTEHIFVRFTKSPDGSENTNFVHRKIRCDGCGSVPLCGQRYKCTECINYDLCTGCLGNKIHSYHEFEEVELKGNSIDSWNKYFSVMMKGYLPSLYSVFENCKDDF